VASVFLGVIDRTFTYSFVVGKFREVGPGFRIPIDIALAPDDIIYVVNRGYELRPKGVRITVIRLADDGEEYINEFGTYGKGPGEFLWPTSIALDKYTNVYIADEHLHRITVHNKDGEYLTHWGDQGSGNGELNRPSGLAIRDDILFVVDSRNHRVQKLTLDGKYIGQFGSFGDGPGQLNTPWGIGLDKDGNVFVADWRNDRIQSFSTEGEWLASFGRPGTGGDASLVRLHGGIRIIPRTAGEFNRPTGVCVDKDGDIYVADWLNNRVQVLTPEGRFITEFTGDAGLSKWGLDSIKAQTDMIRQSNSVRDFGPKTLLWAPIAVKFDENRRRVIIVDSSRHRFQIYQKNTEPVLVY
jgi:DNA-binding beta-propeller fold protein YncE